MFNSSDMRIKYTKEQFIRFSNEEILEKTKGQAVDFHLNNGHWSQLCVGDFLGLESESGNVYTRTGIKMRLQDVDYIGVLG